MKLIDAELFLEEISKGATVEDLKKLVTECKGVLVTVKAEPVLHCNDCKHWHNGVNITYCYKLSLAMIKGNDYCSFGERREP